MFTSQRPNGINSHSHRIWRERNDIQESERSDSEEDIEIELTLSKRKRLLRQLKRDKRHCRTESSIFSHCKIRQTEKPLSVIRVSIWAVRDHVNHSLGSVYGNLRIIS